jgi:hypothetical protein
MSRALMAALAVVRAWVRCYTAAAPAPWRAVRRDELAADVHDHLADLAERGAGGPLAALEILRRLVLGVPADLSWALGPGPLEETAKEVAMTDRTRILAVTGWTTALVLGALGLMGALAGLRDGRRELGQHWWSTLALGGVGLAAAGLAVTLAVLRAARRRA